MTYTPQTIGSDRSPQPGSPSNVEPFAALLKLDPKQVKRIRAEPVHQVLQRMRRRRGLR